MFLMCSFMTPLKSQFSRDPLHCSLIPLPPPYDTPLICYLWKGIFKAHIDVAVSWCMDNFSQNMLTFTGIWPLTHIVNISAFYPYLDLSPFYSSSPTAAPHRFWGYWE